MANVGKCKRSRRGTDYRASTNALHPSDGDKKIRAFQYFNQFIENDPLIISRSGLSICALVYFTLGRTRPMAGAHAVDSPRSSWSIWAEHLRNAPLRAGFGIGFLILFAFIGTFTFVNFVLVRAPIGLSMMGLGFVYLVFLPSIFTTPLAGRAVERFGARATLWGALGLAGAGLPLLLLPWLPAVLAGLTMIGVGTFFAQATDHRVHRPRRHRRPRLGERHLSRLLLSRRHRRQRRPRAAVRSRGLGSHAWPGSAPRSPSRRCSRRVSFYRRRPLQPARPDSGKKEPAGRLPCRHQATPQLSKHCGVIRLNTNCAQ